MSFAVLAEDISDADSIASIIRLIKQDKSISVAKRGFGGAGELFNQGSAVIKAFNTAKGSNRFIICYDSDGEDRKIRKKRIIDEIIKPANVEASYCALVPVQEIEAWFLSDLNAIKKVFNRFEIKKDIPNPESIASPKEYLRSCLKPLKPIPKYVVGMHNPLIASNLNIDLVMKKCSSFTPLFDLVKNGKGNTN